jgi:Flp pilus assembly pilin Flp
MFKTLLKNKKAQNTAEYALLIALVVAGVIAMQTYAQRALQARVRDAGLYLASTTSTIGKTNQYEPYYLSTNYTIDRSSNETFVLDNDTTDYIKDNLRGRVGRQDTQYNTTFGVINGI